MRPVNAAALGSVLSTGPPALRGWRRRANGGVAGEPRALVVSYEPFHRSGLATVCPITASRSEARYPGDVPIPAGVAGQTRDSVNITSQVRTISLRRVSSAPLGTVTDRGLRRAMRMALAHHLGLDIPAIADGAR